MCSPDQRRAMLTPQLAPQQPKKKQLGDTIRGLVAMRQATPAAPRATGGQKTALGF
jgi:hypothetical protein